MGIISLLTDFGLSDPFVAEMKAIILSICPEAKIIDITHQVEKFNIRMGAFLLASAAPYFPEGTIHIAVVDPGVGSERRPIVIETRHAVFIGPDNGVLSLAAQRETILHVYEVTNRSLMREDVCATFHGRDVFAPAAAHLACGKSAKDCGPEIFPHIQPTFREPKFHGKSATYEILYVDGFGNIITNLTSDLLDRLGLKIGQKILLTFRKKRLSARYVRTFSDLRKGEFGVLIGSHGFLEIARREASAAKGLSVKIGSVGRVCGA